MIDSEYDEFKCTNSLCEKMLYSFIFIEHWWNLFLVSVKECLKLSDTRVKFSIIRTWLTQLFQTHSFVLSVQLSLIILQYYLLKGRQFTQGHRWILPGNYPIFAVLMLIYHYIEKIWRIIITPDFCITYMIIKNIIQVNQLYNH